MCIEHPYLFMCACRKEMRPVVLKKQADLPFADIGRKVAELWKDISDAEKEKYKAKAKALNAAAKGE
jgi:hypothetical protein